MARGLQGVMLRGFGARDHTATVLETVWIAPHFVRVRMVSETLFEDATVEPTAWLRFWFPDPDGSDTEFQRAYTITEGDAGAGRFAVDVLLHEPAGPASRWACTVTPGATIPVMSLMGSSRFDVPSTPEAQPAGYLLIGDAASIPGVNGIISTVPDGVPIELYLEQHDDNDALIPLAQHPRTGTRGPHRRPPPSSMCAPGCAASSDFPKPRSTRRPTGAPGAPWEHCGQPSRPRTRPTVRPPRNPVQTGPPHRHRPRAGTGVPGPPADRPTLPLTNVTIWC